MNEAEDLTMHKGEGDNAQNVRQHTPAKQCQWTGKNGLGRKGVGIRLGDGAATQVSHAEQDDAANYISQKSGKAWCFKHVSRWVARDGLQNCDIDGHSSKNRRSHPDMTSDQCLKRTRAISIYFCVPNKENENISDPEVKFAMKAQSAAAKRSGICTYRLMRHHSEPANTEEVHRRFDKPPAHGRTALIASLNDH